MLVGMGLGHIGASRIIWYAAPTVTVSHAHPSREIEKKSPYFFDMTEQVKIRDIDDNSGKLSIVIHGRNQIVIDIFDESSLQLAQEALNMLKTVMNSNRF
jgi:hypothetical protein